MVLLKYFERIEPSKEEKIQSVLPKPDGLLPVSMPCTAIEATNYNSSLMVRPLIFTECYCLQYKSPHLQYLLTEDFLFSYK